MAAALQAGDEAVMTVVADRARRLGWGLATLHVGVGVETFVLVGGFASEGGEFFRTEVVRGRGGVLLEPRLRLGPGGAGRRAR